MSDQEELAAYRRMAELDDKANGGSQSLIKNVGGMLANTVGAVGEPLLNMATGMVAKPLSDIAGLAATGVDMATGSDRAAEFKKYIQDKLTYSPRTAAGQAVAESPYNPFNVVGKVVGGTADAARSVVEGNNPSPIRQAAGQFIQEAIPQALNIAGTAYAPKAKTYIGKLEENQRAALDLKNSQSAIRNQTLKAAFDEGLIAQPSTINPSNWNTVREGLAGKSALAQSISDINSPIIQSMARKSIGVADDVALDQGVTRGIRAQAYEKGYAPLEAIGNIPTDDVFRAQLNQLASKHVGAAKSFPGAFDDSVSNLVNKINVGEFDVGDALKASQLLRDEARGDFLNNPNVAIVKKGLSKAIEDQIQRTLADGGPNAEAMLKNYRDARELMAKSHVVEDSIVTGGGIINPAKLAARIQKSPGSLTGELKTIGDFANIAKGATKLPEPVIGPSANQFTTRSLLGALVGGGSGMALGGPIGAAAALTPFVIPPIMRKQILSGSSQNALASISRIGTGQQLINGGMQISPNALAAMLANATNDQQR